MNATVAANRHVVDQLADVRAQVKALEAKETALKAEISKRMGGRDSLGGDEWIALQTLSTRKGSIDADAAKRAGVDLDRFRKADVTVFSLRLERRVMEEG